MLQSNCAPVVRPHDELPRFAKRGVSLWPGLCRRPRCSYAARCVDVLTAVDHLPFAMSYFVLWGCSTTATEVWRMRYVSIRSPVCVTRSPLRWTAQLPTGRCRNWLSPKESRNKCNYSFRFFSSLRFVLAPQAR